MTIALWRIGTDTRNFEASDLGGKGAEALGGRWNRKGRPVVYASESIALACLETVVHLGGEILPLNRFLVRIDVPDDIWRARRILTASTAPVGWNALPEGKASLDFGDAWLQAAPTALLAVPSVIVPENFNVLINPSHPDAARVVAAKVRQWIYDGRIADPRRRPA